MAAGEGWDVTGPSTEPNAILANARIEESDPGCWQATVHVDVFEVVDGMREKTKELIAGRFEISIDDAIAELTRRGDMTGHEAIGARRRATIASTC